MSVVLFGDHMQPLKLSEDFDVFQKQYANMLDQAYIEGNVSTLMYIVLVYKQYTQRAHQELAVMHKQMLQVTNSMNVYTQQQKRANREGNALDEEVKNQSYEDYVASFF
jgi:hypothetical protein